MVSAEKKQAKVILRDYSLTGNESQRAIKQGLADAEWYKIPVDKEKMNELLTRKNGAGIRDTILWFGLIITSGYLFLFWWGTWLAIVPYIVYSVLYASISDSRWHESSHGTVFKTDWMNNVLYEIASFMVFRQSNVWRWSHSRHHSDTIIRGRDPEIAVPRPPKVFKIMLAFIGLSGGIPEFKRLIVHASGKMDTQAATYVPASEYGRVFFVARIYLLVYLIVIGLAIYFQSILPLMYIGLPTLLGSWLMPFYSLTQHTGLQENVLDHRLNCRTVYMNRINRFLYWNMNYHIEHHMYPLVPYHALSKLHALIKHDCPTPYNGIVDAFREIVPAVIKQIKTPTYYVKRTLPASADSKTADSITHFVGDLSDLQDGKIKVCRMDQIGLANVARFDFDEKTYAVYRTANDEYFATDGICSHGKTHLAEGMVIGGIIECPKHNGRFNIKDGTPARKPVCERINAYIIHPIGSDLFLEL
jgi:MocE subfamily Rieske [2Fe-2S] domain protein